MKRTAFMISLFCTIFCLMSCARPHYYQNNGVHYFTKPAKELSAYLPFHPVNDQMTWCGRALVSESTMYLPVWRMPRKGGENTITIYAYDTVKHTIADSLVLSKPLGLSSISCIAGTQDLYLIGVYNDNKVRKLVIIKTDKQFQTNEVHTYDIEAKGIIDASQMGTELSVLIYTGPSSTSLVKVNTDVMTANVAKVLTAKNRCTDMQDGFLYALSNDTPDKTINIIKFDLSKPDAVPEVIAFPFILSGTNPDSTRQFKLDVNGDTALFAYTKQADIEQPSEAVSTLMKLNLKTREYKAIDFSGYTFEVMEDASSITMFKSEFKPSYRKYANYQALAISEIDSDLKTETELITFLPSEWNYALYAYKLQDNQMAMVGTYQFINKKSNLSSFTPFVGFYNLK